VNTTQAGTAATLRVHLALATVVELLEGGYGDALAEAFGEFNFSVREAMDALS
jgi:hypothetical protein